MSLLTLCYNIKYAIRGAFFHTTQHFLSSLCCKQPQRLMESSRRRLKLLWMNAASVQQQKRRYVRKKHTASISLWWESVCSALVHSHPIRSRSRSSSPCFQEMNKICWNFLSSACCQILKVDMLSDALDPNDQHKPSGCLLLECCTAYLHMEHLHRDENGLSGLQDCYADTQNASSSLHLCNRSPVKVDSCHLALMQLSRQDLQREGLWALIPLQQVCSLLRGDTSVERQDIVFMLRQMLLFIFFSLLRLVFALHLIVFCFAGCCYDDVRPRIARKTRRFRTKIFVRNDLRKERKKNGTTAFIFSCCWKFSPYCWQKQAQKCISAQLLVFKWTGGNGWVQSSCQPRL